MLLSVIIPYYNAEKWIGRCLDSLLHQNIDKDDYEIIVVDDGSTNSIDLLNEYVTYSPNIKYFWQKNAKQSAARNQGLLEATGEYVFFCDSDDYVEENVLGTLLSIAKENELDVLFHNRKRVTPDDIYVRQEHLDFSLEVFSGIQLIDIPLHKDTPNIGVAPTLFLVKRNLLLDSHLQFDTDMIMREDRKFVVEMLMRAHKIGRTNAVVYYYVQNPESVTHLLGKKKQSSVYVNNIVSYIKYLSAVLASIKGFGWKQDIIDCFEKEIDRETFIVLHNMIRFCSIKQNYTVIRTLKDMGIYPLKEKGGKHLMLKALMSNAILWFLLCFIIHLVPKQIRIRFI